MVMTSAMTEIRLLKISSLSDKQLYRNILRQAKLLSHIFQDPILFLSHSYLARLHFTFIPNPTITSDLQANSISNQQNKAQAKKKLSERDLELQSFGFQTSIELKEQRKRARLEHQLKSLSSANLGYSHSVDRCISQAYGRRGKLRHELLAPFEPQRPLPQAPQSKARLQHPLIFPSLRLLLLSRPAKFFKTTKIQSSHLEYPPIKFLPIPYEESPQRMALGEEKRLSKRREANGRWRWIETTFDKIRGPLSIRDGILDYREQSISSSSSSSSSNSEIESGNFTSVEKQKNVKTLRLNEEKILKGHNFIVKHLESLSSETFPISGSQRVYKQKLSTPASLKAYRDAVEFGTPRFASSSSLPSFSPPYQKISNPSSNQLYEELNEEENDLSEYRPSASRKLRKEGWKHSPIDFTKDGRGRRRRYGSLLTYIPILKEINFLPKSEKNPLEVELDSNSLSNSNCSIDSTSNSISKEVEVENQVDYLSPFSSLSKSRISLNFNSSKSPFETKYLAELIDEVNNPNPFTFDIQSKQNTKSSPGSRIMNSVPKSRKFEFVYSDQALHPSGSEDYGNLESKRGKLLVNEEELKILGLE